MHLRHVSSHSLNQIIDDSLFEVSISIPRHRYVLVFNHDKISCIKKCQGAVCVRVKVNIAFILLLRAFEDDTHNLIEI